MYNYLGNSLLSYEIMLTEQSIKQISEDQSTPCFVFDENELIRRAQEIRKILGDISFCYSIKANPFLIPALIPVVDYFEVCSPGELSICKELLVPGKMIIYSGVHKEREDIEEAINYKVSILTAESRRHYDIIKESCRDLNVRVNLILRLTSKSQFGMSEEDIKSILSDSSPDINIIGIHYFAGTGRKQAKKHHEELMMLTDFIKDLRQEYKLELPMLEYGPGLFYPYFEDDDFSDTLLPLKEISESLAEVSKTCKLSVEMGRFLASECGYYISSICDIKHSSGNNWCILDGGINHVNYLGQMMGMKVPVIGHYRNGIKIDDSNGDPYTVCGSLCTTNDVLVRTKKLDSPQIGDTLVFSNIGAYSVTESMGLFLSRSLPKIISYHDNKLTLIRNQIESWKINIRDKE